VPEVGISTGNRRGAQEEIAKVTPRDAAAIWLRKRSCPNRSTIKTRKPTRPRKRICSSSKKIQGFHNLSRRLLERSNGSKIIDVGTLVTAGTGNSGTAAFQHGAERCASRLRVSAAKRMRRRFTKDSQRKIVSPRISRVRLLQRPTSIFRPLSFQQTARGFVGNPLDFFELLQIRLRGLVGFSFDQYSCLDTTLFLTKSRQRPRPGSVTLAISSPPLRARPVPVAAIHSRRAISASSCPACTLSPISTFQLFSRNRWTAEKLSWLKAWRPRAKLIPSAYCRDCAVGPHSPRAASFAARNSHWS